MTVLLQWMYRSQTLGKGLNSLWIISDSAAFSSQHQKDVALFCKQMKRERDCNGVACAVIDKTGGGACKTSEKMALNEGEAVPKMSTKQYQHY